VRTAARDSSAATHILNLIYIYFMGSKTLPFACYISYDESSIPFYSTSNGYKYIRLRKHYRHVDQGLGTKDEFLMG